MRFHLYEILQQAKPTHSDRKRISCCPEQELRGWTTERQQGTSWSARKFYIPVVVVVTQVYLHLLKPTQYG